MMLKVSVHLTFAGITDKRFCREGREEKYLLVRNEGLLAK